MTPLDIPALRALAAAARERADAFPRDSESNGPPTCRACGDEYIVCSGFEAGDYCDVCAHNVADDVPALTDALVAALDELRRLRNVESAALAWRGVARCPDHAETMYWCDSCVRSEDADEALADALSAGRGSK